MRFYSKLCSPCVDRLQRMAREYQIEWNARKKLLGSLNGTHRILRIRAQKKKKKKEKSKADEMRKKIEGYSDWMIPSKKFQVVGIERLNHSKKKNKQNQKSKKQAKSKIKKTGQWSKLVQI